MNNRSLAGARAAPVSEPAQAGGGRTGGTLQAGWTAWRTPSLAGGIVLLLFCLAEVAARSPALQAAVAAPYLGGQHHLLEMQVHYLNRLVRQSGKVDCLFLGNSMVWQGFDVMAFSRRYHEITGQQITCYNFGVDGLPASAAGAVAEVLVRDYRPRLLIYGTDARDFAVPADAPDATAVLEMSWLRYRNGQFSPIGWLYHHSYALRYRRILHDLVRFDSRHILPGNVETRMANNLGFNPEDNVATNVSVPPDPHTAEGPIAYYYGLLSHYTILPENLAGLDTVLELSRQTQVLIVEMPVPRTYMAFFGDGDRDHLRFVTEIDQRTTEHGIPFWTTTTKNLIPDNGWLDYSHMNRTGAQVFSRWMGERVAQAADEWELYAHIP